VDSTVVDEAEAEDSVTVAVGEAEDVVVSVIVVDVVEDVELLEEDVEALATEVSLLLKARRPHSLRPSSPSTLYQFSSFCTPSFIHSYCVTGNLVYNYA